MSQINPLFGVVVQSTQVQQRQSVEKDQQARRVANLTKDAALRGDRLEHQVESAEAISPAQEQAQEHNSPQRPPADSRKSDNDQGQGESHLDVIA